MTWKAISWHPADIKAAVAKSGHTLSQVAEAHGLDKSTISQAMRRPCYAGEQAIAAALGLPAHQIWPGRYDSAGIPKHPRIRKQINANKVTAELQNDRAA